MQQSQSKRVVFSSSSRERGQTPKLTEIVLHSLFGPVVLPDCIRALIMSYSVRRTALRKSTLRFPMLHRNTFRGCRKPTIRRRARSSYPCQLLQFESFALSSRLIHRVNLLLQEGCLCLGYLMQTAEAPCDLRYQYCPKPIFLC